MANVRLCEMVRRVFFFANPRHFARPRLQSSENVNTKCSDIIHKYKKEIGTKIRTLRER